MSDVIYLQAWPGRGDPPERPRREPVPPFASASRLIVAAAADRDAEREERFGLLVWRLVDGSSTVGAGLVVPDGHPRADGLSAWCAEQVVETPAGDHPWICETLSDFLDPFSGRFERLVYSRGAWLVCADVGRVLGLLAEFWTPGRRSWAAGFTLWPSGWSELHEGADGRVRRRSVSPHRPPIHVTVMTPTSYRVAFGRPPGGPSCGKRNLDGSHFEGRFFDVVGAAVPLDGIDSSDLADHAEAFGFVRKEQLAAVRVDRDGAAVLASALDVVCELADVLDAEGRKWFTTASERRERLGRLDLRWTPTAGTLAARIEERSGASPMLWRLGAPDDEAMGRWIGAHHGGWLSAELAGAGPFPAADIDIRAAYPAMYVLLGLADLRHAERFETEDVTDDLRALLAELARGDVRALFDPTTWRRFGATVCEVVCAAETWPAESADPDFPEGHSAMRALSCAVAPLPFTWPDVARATLRSGRVVDVRSAIRLVGVTAGRGIGLDPGLRARFPLYDGRWVRRGQDEVVALVRLRECAKRAGDDRLAAQLRVVVNAFCYGGPARIDERTERLGRRRVPVEVVARGTFPPIAASVTAACRLAVGMFEHLLCGEGYAVASRDTDGLLLVASPRGGSLTLDDGRQVAAGSFEALERAVEQFDDAFSPFGRGVSFFKPVLREKDGRPLVGVVLRVKRYALGTLDESGNLLEVVEATEHGLGGQVVDPPRMAGRAASGRHAWTGEVAAEALRQAIARRRGEHRKVEPWAWDEGEAGRFPQLERCQAASPRALDDLEERYGLRLRPFGLYVMGSSRPPLGVTSAPAVAALDPGGPLDDWSRSLAFYDEQGQRQPVTTDSAQRYRAHALRSVDEKAIRWMAPRPFPDRPVIVTDPRLIRPVGRSGRLVEARGAGDQETPAKTLRVEYGGPDLRTVIVERVHRMGPSAFAAAYGVPFSTAKAWAKGRRPSAAWVRRLLPVLGHAPLRECALGGCSHPVSNPRACYCSCPDHSAHRLVAQKRRQRQSETWGVRQE